MATRQCACTRISTSGLNQGCAADMGDHGPKEQRHQDLRQLLTDNPFFTDRALADKLGVSVQTIRLDRRELGIPDVRSRIRKVAREAYDKVKSISKSEVVGELLDLVLGDSALSVMTASPDMALEHSGVVRGHHLFAMANSLAVAVVDAKVALTGSASVRFVRPAHVGDRMVAKAKVSSLVGRRYIVDVVIKVDSTEIFVGEFTVFAVDSD